MPLNFRNVGVGEPVLLIHGLFGSLENLGAIARSLTEIYNVYSVDLPNHGKSLHTESTDLDSMASIVVEWMDEHGLNCVSVVGHSLGGKVAMEIALKYPERVKQLVVIDIAPVAYTRRHDSVFAGLLSFNPRLLESRQEAEGHLAKHVKDVPVRSFLLKNLQKQAEGGFAWRMNLPVIHEGYSDLIKGNVEDKTYCGQVLFLKGAESDYIQEQFRHEIINRFPQASLKLSLIHI